MKNRNLKALFDGQNCGLFICLCVSLIFPFMNVSAMTDLLDKWSSAESQKSKPDR